MTMHRTPLAIILALISIGGNIDAFSTPQYHPRTQQQQLSTTSTLFAGGGFGATSKSSAAPSKKKKGKKSKSSGLLDLEVSTPEETSASSSGPKLDRFGLPLPTEDDIFPPLSPDIKRSAADNVDEFNQDMVAEAIKNHLGVNLNVFDTDGYSTHQEGDNRWKLNLLHKDPPVFQINNFFTEDECQSYMSMVDPQQSNNNDDQQQSNAVQMTSPTFSSLSISRRTSTTWFCRYKGVPTLLAKAQRLLNDVELNQFEEPQVVRYRTGEEFSWHYDEIPKTQLSNGGQRLATLLVYLNDLEEDLGGGTVFRDLTPPTTTGGIGGSSENKGKKSKRSKGNTTSNNNDTNNKQHLTVRPRTGTALLFFPSYKDGTPDQRTLHKGEVALDTKMIARLWIHEREYQAGVPEGNLQSDAVDEVEREAARLGFI